MRIVLVTGANGGLGQAISRAFLLESKKNVVFLAVRTQREAAAKLESEFGSRAVILPLDVTDRAAWNAAMKSILDRHGRLDVLVNNAGAHEDSLLGMMPVESWDRVLATNLDAVFHGVQTALPAMISQRKGRIVNISSLSALSAPAGQANYAAAKAGVVALTQSVAKEVARLNITVNAVCPGYIETPAVSELDPAKKQAALALIPMRRFGRAEEVASVVTFLASDQASYVTGSVIKVDGGIF